jgi:hypothetical protein
MVVGGFNPSEKYKNQLGFLFPTYGKTKNVPNHQPVWCFSFNYHVLLSNMFFFTCACRDPRNDAEKSRMLVR